MVNTTIGGKKGYLKGKKTYQQPNPIYTNVMKERKKERKEGRKEEF